MRPRKSKPVVGTERRWSPGGAFGAALASIGVYFALLLVPEWWPGHGRSSAFLLYALSIPFVFLGLIGLAVWGVVGAIRSRRRGAPLSGLHRALMVLPLAGLMMFGSTLVVARTIRGPLPRGSHLLEFDAEVWRSPGSSEFVRNDITPRQKMLGSLVERLEPTQSRSDLEALLGSSLETRYFESTGRDLIYILGPERSFFGIDSEWLLIWLDDSGHLERYEVYKD